MVFFSYVRCLTTVFYSVRSLNAQQLTVGLGKRLLNETVERYAAERLIPHSGFSPMTVQNDIGLVRLAVKIVYQDKIKPIPMAVEDFSRENYPVTLTGWGRLFVSESYIYILFSFLKGFQLSPSFFRQSFCNASTKSLIFRARKARRQYRFLERCARKRILRMRRRSLSSSKVRFFALTIGNHELLTFFFNEVDKMI